MLNAYLDESGIHDGAAICVVSGYFGGPGQWKKFEKFWRKTLDDAHLPLEEFHATDTVKNRRHTALLHNLASVISKSKIHPVTNGVVIDDFNSFSLEQRRFLTGARPRDGKFITSGCPNKPYFLAFQECVKVITDHAPIGGRADFFFGLDRPFAEFAKSLFDEMKANPLFELRGRLGHVNFPLAKQTPQLQAADLLVHLTYLDMQDRLETGKWEKPIPPLLMACLRNARVADDLTYYNKQTMSNALAFVNRL